MKLSKIILAIYRLYYVLLSTVAIKNTKGVYDFSWGLLNLTNFLQYIYLMNTSKEDNNLLVVIFSRLLYNISGLIILTIKILNKTFIIKDEWYIVIVMQEE